MEREHDRTQRARAFGQVADEYERGRPGYPRAAIEWLLGAEPLEVVDLAAGTGKLTRTLIDCGHRVVAVEPLPQMRAVLSASAPEALLLEGSAERMPLPEGSAEAIVVGAAFHWFEHEPALAEIARVLRPPAILGLLGNGLDESVPWVAELRKRLGSRRPGERDRRWPAPGRLEEQFESVQEREFPHSQSIDLEGLCDLAVSRSAVALMDASEREALFSELGQLWREHVGAERAELAWRTRVLRASGLRRAGAGGGGR